MPEVFYVSDLHLGEPGMLRYRQQFSSIEEHDQYIIDRWNSRVTKRDVVWVMGDLGLLARYKELRGSKYAVLGNHDKHQMHDYLRNFGRVSGASAGLNVKGFKVIGTHIPIHPQEFYRWEFNVHGHNHAKPILLTDKEVDLRYIPVCLEHTDYYPMPREELQEQMACRKELLEERRHGTHS